MADSSADIVPHGFKTSYRRIDSPPTIEPGQQDDSLDACATVA
jgi:hypothetical protein